jgi:Tellurite resistance protein TerB
VRDEGRIDPELAVLVVGLAKSSNLLFGGTADYLVVQEFAEAASYDEKLALARCLFAVAATDESISMAEEAELHRIMNQLRIQPHDLTALRVEHRKFLPGLSGQ